MSYQLDSMFSKTEAAPEHTGSVARAPDLKDQLPPEADLVFTRTAASDVLTRGGKDSSLPWENPRTGARGSVTPLGADYHSDGLVCRDFLASHVRDSKESWMQGEACRKSGDRTASSKWEVRSLKPWRRS